jgi:xanthine dehydrogenase accessory factor
MNTEVLLAATRCLKKEIKSCIATVVSANGSAPRGPGAQMLVTEKGDIVGTIGGGVLEHMVMQACLKCIKTGQPEQLKVHLTRDLGMCCGGEMEVFMDPVQQKQKFLMFGAGHVAHALAPILAALNFDVCVIDDRPELIEEDRFPLARRRIEDGIEFAANYKGGPDTFFLVVTHDHQRDQDLVEQLLPKECAWLGLIGSRSKIAKFFMRYRAAGIDEAYFDKISGPVGLAIGAQTPTEIAVSIAAEVVRVRRGHEGPTIPLSEVPIPARGGDGMARAPALKDTGTK